MADGPKDTLGELSDSLQSRHKGGAGGPSGENERPRHQRADIRLIERALRERWEIPQGLRDSLPRLLTSLAVNERSGPRTRVQAAKAILAMDKVNIDAVKVIQADETAGLVNDGSQYATEARAWFAAHPEQWVAHVLGVSAWRDHPEECADQISLFRSIFEHRRTACKSGHKTGKTFVLAAATLAWLHLYPEAKVITTAPTGRQVRELLWREIHRLHKQAARNGNPLGGDLLQMKYTLGPDRFAIGFATDEQHEGVQAQGWSGERVLVIFDEGGGVPRSLWEVANTVLQTPTSHIVAAGNPHDPATPFYDACVSKLWHTITLSSWRAPSALGGHAIAPGTATVEWCEEMLELLGENDPQYQFRVLGEFPDASAHTLVRLSDCEAAQKRERVESGVRVGGVDVARFGDDRTVITAMDGGHIEEVLHLSGADVPDVAARVAIMYRERKWSSVAVDDTGVGGGVTDILHREKDLVVIPVNFGEGAFAPRKYANKATEMFAMLADDLKAGRISGLPAGDIVRDLTARLYTFTLRQQMQLEAKKVFKQRIGRSPDDGDSLLLANYARHLAGGAAQTISQVFA